MVPSSEARFDCKCISMTFTQSYTRAIAAATAAGLFVKNSPFRRYNLQPFMARDAFAISKGEICSFAANKQLFLQRKNCNCASFARRRKFYFGCRQMQHLFSLISVPVNLTLFSSFSAVLKPPKQSCTVLSVYTRNTPYF